LLTEHNVWRATTDDKHAAVLTGKNGIAGTYFSPEGQKFEFDFKHDPVLSRVNINHLSSLVLLGSSLFIPLRDGIQISHEIKKNNPALSEELKNTIDYGVVELNLLTNQVSDRSTGLDGYDATGNRFSGACSHLCLNKSKNTFYVSTEKAVYCMPVGGKSWEAIFPGHGETKINVVGDELTITSTQGQFLYSEGYCYNQGELPGETRVYGAFKVGNYLVLFDQNEKPTLPPRILYSEINKVKDPEPILGKYLNIADSNNAVKIGDKILLPTLSGIYEIESENETLLTSTPALAIATCDTRTIAANNSQIFSLDGKSLVNFPPAEDVRIAVSENAVALIKKQKNSPDELVVFDKDLKIAYQFSETGTFLNSVVYAGEHLCVGGFSNRRNKNDRN
ncbi:hypothetical protein PN435_05205, partial [Nodularia spumigena CS-590/02]